MSRTLWRSSFRYLSHHLWQFGLSVLGVALGVAVVVSVDLASESARRAFQLSTDAVTGRTTHQVVGGPGGLNESIYRRLRLDLDVRKAAPFVEGYVSLPAQPGRLLHVTGIDPFSEALFRNHFRIGTMGSELGPFLTVSGTCLLSTGTASSLGVAPGDTFQVQAGTIRRQVTVAGLLHPADDLSRQALADLLVVDISTAQELLGMLGRLSRIDLIVGESMQERDLLDRIGALLPPGVQVLPAAARSSTTLQMTRAFRTNLTALSLLALVCGIFLVYNTICFSVVQRRSLIGSLRALGVTRREVFTLILGEALIVGLFGTLLGLAGGIAIGSALMQLVTRTINDLYFVLSVRTLTVDALSLMKGIALGFCGTLVAALSPALEATTASPRMVMLRSQEESRALRRMQPAAFGGCLLLTFGAVLLWISSRSLPISFASLFAIIIGFALLTPAVVVGLMRLARPPMSLMLGTLGRMATRGVTASLSRTAVAIAALMIAVSVIIGVGVMIDSFRATVASWLDSTLVADLYVAPPGRRSGNGANSMISSQVAQVTSVPSVDRVSTIRATQIESKTGRTRLIAFDIDSRSYRSFHFKEGDMGQIWPAFQDGGAVIISEPYATRYQLAAGDSIRLRTDRGQRDFPIAGIYFDYASQQGLVAMSRRTYERFWDDRGVTGFSVYTAPQANPTEVARSIRQIFAGQQLVIQSNRALRRASLEIFDRTFLITDVLQLLVTLVAFVGVLSALMALQLERVREFGVLRAIGLTPQQVWNLVSLQSGLIGFASGLLAIPVGLTLAAIMIFVINRRAFGWTLQMQVAPDILLQSLLLALCAAVIAGLYPALRMSRTSPAAALRGE
ncbi:MAG: FtsX-like permease family protein [Acidobacteriota bacterium]